MRALIITVLVSLVAPGMTPALCQSLSGQLYGVQVVGSQLGMAGPEAWSYTVSNTSSSPNYTVWLFAIGIDEGVDVTNVFSPDGWAADASVPQFVTWTSTMTDLPAGQSKTGFVAEFSATPTNQTWSAMFNNLADPYEMPTDGGPIITVPEPGSLTALIAGLGFAAGLLRKRRS